MNGPRSKRTVDPLDLALARNVADLMLLIRWWKRRV